MVKKFSQYLNESSLSRLYQWSSKYDFGIITAFRYAPDCGSGEPYTKQENLQRNSSLLAKLRASGYSVTSIKGSYIENYGSKNAREVGENSFFVADIQNHGTLNQDLQRLGGEFEQDSIIFGEAGGSGVLIGTNNCPEGYPGFGVKVPQGGAIFGKDGEFMSRVNGRPFVFAENCIIQEYGVAKYPTELRGPVTQANKKWQDL